MGGRGGISARSSSARQRAWVAAGSLSAPSLPSLRPTHALLRLPQRHARGQRGRLSEELPCPGHGLRKCPLLSLGPLCRPRSSIKRGLSSHSTAPSASPAVCVPTGWWPAAMAAASPCLPAPVCTTRPATSQARPSTWAATPGTGLAGGRLQQRDEAQPGQPWGRAAGASRREVWADGHCPPAPVRVGRGSVPTSPAWPPARCMGMATTSPLTGGATASAGTASTRCSRYTATELRPPPSLLAAPVHAHPSGPLLCPQDHCSGNGSTQDSFRVITENVPCGTTGTTCSKAIKIFLGVSRGGGPGRSPPRRPCSHN